MNETNNAVRKTVYLDEELTKRCEILFGEADVSSFSQFVTKALETYIDRYYNKFGQESRTASPAFFPSHA